MNGALSFLCLHRSGTEPGTVQLQDVSVTLDYTAREVDGEERSQWWERAVEAFPDYADYEAKTDRRIAVFVLESIAA